MEIVVVRSQPVDHNNFFSVKRSALKPGFLRVGLVVCEMKDALDRSCRFKIVLELQWSYAF